MKQAHIVFPQVPEDLKTLALCGKKMKPKHYDADVPVELPTCPDCADWAVTLLRESDEGLLVMVRRLDLIEQFVNQARDSLVEKMPRFIEITTSGHEYAQRQTEKALNELLASEEQDEKPAKKAKKKKGK